MSQFADTILSFLVGKKVDATNEQDYETSLFTPRVPKKLERFCTKIKGRNIMKRQHILDLLLSSDKHHARIKLFLQELIDNGGNCCFLNSVNQANHLERSLETTQPNNPTQDHNQITQDRSLSLINETNSSNVTSKSIVRELRNLAKEKEQNVVKNKYRQKAKKKKVEPKKKTTNAKKNKISKKLERVLTKYDNHSEMHKFADLSKLNLEAKSDTIIGNSGKKRPDFENSITNAFQKSELFFDFFKDVAHECNIHLVDILYAQFVKYPSEIMDLCHAVQMTNRIKSKDQAKFLELKNWRQTERMDEANQLKMKDDLGISNINWKEVAFACKERFNSDLSIFTNKVNGLVVKHFHLKQKNNGFVLKLAPLIEGLIKADLHQKQSRANEDLPTGPQSTKATTVDSPISNNSNGETSTQSCHELLPDDVKIKISMDGRVLGALRTVVITLQILNLQTYGTQERNSVFPISMYVGEEEEVELYLEEFKAEMETLGHDGIIIMDDGNVDLGFKERGFSHVQVPLTFYWISDLKSLSCVSALRKVLSSFCPFCNCKRHESLGSLKETPIPLFCPRDLHHTMGIPSKNIYICILHLDERITEYLMRMSLMSSEYEKTLLTNLQTLKGFKKFTFSHKEIIHGDCTEEDNLIENIHEYSFMFTGSHCKRIFGNLDKVIGFLETNGHSEMYQIWNQWRSIRKWLFFTTEQLNKKSKEEFDQLRTDLISWGSKFDKLRANGKTIGDYIHIAVNHLHSILTTIGSLVPLSNQGVENSHSHDRWIMDRGVSRAKMIRGTKKKKTNSDEESEITDNVPNLTNESVNAIPETQPNENESQTEIDNTRSEQGKRRKGRRKGRKKIIKEFSYEALIPNKPTGCYWNDLYVISQIILKKLRILYLSFNYESVTFKRHEQRDGKVVNKFWTRDADDILKPPMAFRNESSCINVNTAEHTQQLTNSSIVSEIREVDKDTEQSMEDSVMTDAEMVPEHAEQETSDEEHKFDAEEFLIADDLGDVDPANLNLLSRKRIREVVTTITNEETRDEDLVNAFDVRRDDAFRCESDSDYDEEESDEEQHYYEEDDDEHEIVSNHHPIDEEEEEDFDIFDHMANVDPEHELAELNEDE